MSGDPDPPRRVGLVRSTFLRMLRMAGLATDFCVAYSALDAVEQGFSVEVVMAATRGIDIMGSMEEMLGKMRAAGVVIH
jgi:nicotinamidase/pyrazinamidase